MGERLEMPPGVELPDSGGWQPIRCMFHSPDRNPSGSINPDLGYFRCHRCGVHGFYRESSSSPREEKPSRLARRKTPERRERVRLAYGRK